jgi:hypothetical protein
MPPRTGRIYDRSRHEAPMVISHSLGNREESIYGLLVLLCQIDEFPSEFASDHF